MKNIVSTACCIALCCVLALAQGAHKKAVAGAATPMSDQQFVDFAGQTDMLEANLGQLAENQASAQGVKDYAQMLVSDHTNDYTQLSTVAGKANLIVPKGLDAAHDKMIAVRQTERRCLRSPLYSGNDYWAHQGNSGIHERSGRCAKRRLERLRERDASHPAETP